MTRLWIALVLSAAISMVACTRVPVQPAITDFSKSVSDAAAAAMKRFEYTQLDDRIAEALRDELASKNAIYGIDTDVTYQCRPLSPFEVEPGVPLPAFETHCSIVACRSVDSSEEVCDNPALPSYGVDDLSREPMNNELVNAEAQARRSLDALGEYSEALNALATSKTPGDVAKAATDATSAVTTAAETVGNLAGRPISGKFEPIVTTGGTLLAILTEEALEARRYALITSVVRSADPIVADLSQRVANWFFLQKRDDLYGRYDELDSAINSASPGVAADLEVVERARAAAKAADDGAEWRVFWEIAVAHRAIMASMDAPPDFKRLTEANQRIGTVVDSVKAFVNAVETLQE